MMEGGILKERQDFYLRSDRHIAYLIKIARDAGLVDDGTPSIADNVLRALLESSERQSADYDRRNPGARESDRLLKFPNNPNAPSP